MCYSVKYFRVNTSLALSLSILGLTIVVCGASGPPPRSDHWVLCICFLIVVDVSIKIKEFLYPYDYKDPPTPNPTAFHGVRLPKLDVPTFDGDILNWSTFWEQFCIAVRDRTHLSDTEKLAYMRHSLKDDAAKGTVEGLSCSGGQYTTETIRCLKACHNRPKLIHQAYIKRIVDISSLKDGSGKELRQLHESSEGLSSTTNPEPKGNPPTACSGKPRAT